MPAILKYDTNEASSVQSEWLKGVVTASQLKNFYAKHYLKTHPHITIGSEEYATAIRKITGFLSYQKPNDELRFFSTPDGSAGYVILREGKSIQFFRVK